MKHLNTSLIFVITILISITCVNSHATYYEGSGADFLTKIGERHLEEGQVDMAVHEFQKALLLNPEHKKASQYLNEFGLGSGGPSTDATHRAEAARLGRIIRNQNLEIARLKRLEKQNSKFKENYKAFKRNPNKEKTDLQNQISDLENELSLHQKQQRKEIQDAAIYYRNSVSNKELNELDNETLRAKYYKTLEVALNNSDEMLKVSKQNAKLKNYVQNQYAHQDKLIAVLENYIHLHEEKLRRMGNEVTLAKIEEAQAELQTLIKMTESTGVNDENRARLDRLNQKIEELGLIKTN